MSPQTAQVQVSPDFVVELDADDLARIRRALKITASDLRYQAREHLLAGGTVDGGEELYGTARAYMELYDRLDPDGAPIPFELVETAGR